MKDRMGSHFGKLEKIMDLEFFFDFFFFQRSNVGEIVKLVQDTKPFLLSVSKAKTTKISELIRFLIF